MEKDFDRWNEVKKNLESTDREIIFKEGEVWWMSAGINIGSEVCGKGSFFKRPVLILRKLSNKVFIGLPLTSLEKTGSWFSEVTVKGEKRWVLLWQAKTLSVKRLESDIARLSKDDFKRTKEKFKQLLELS